MLFLIKYCLGLANFLLSLTFSSFVAVERLHYSLMLLLIQWILRLLIFHSYTLLLKESSPFTQSFSVKLFNWVLTAVFSLICTPIVKSGIYLVFSFFKFLRFIFTISRAVYRNLSEFNLALVSGCFKILVGLLKVIILWFYCIRILMLPIF